MSTDTCTAQYTHTCSYAILASSATFAFDFTALIGSEEFAGPFGAGRSLGRTTQAAIAILCRWFEQPDSGSLDAFLADREFFIFPSQHALALRLTASAPAKSELLFAP